MAPSNRKSKLPSEDSAANLTEQTVKKIIEETLQSKSFIELIVNSVIEKITEGVMKRLEESFQFDSAIIRNLEEKLTKREADILKLQQALEVRTDEIEQYSRRNNLRLFGIPEGENEDTDNLVLNVARDIGANINMNDICRSHRVGRRTIGKPRPIIVKFTSYRARREIFSRKKQLRGTRVTIREDLTALRLSLLKTAVTRFEVRNVWTMDGVILVKTPDGNIRRVTQLSELP